jgi:hypothetical protein
MSAIPAQRAQDVMRASLASMTGRQLAGVSYQAQIPRSVLVGFIHGEPLSATALHRLGQAMLVRQHFIKQEETEHVARV